MAVQPFEMQRHPSSISTNDQIASFLAAASHRPQVGGNTGNPSADFQAALVAAALANSNKQQPSRAAVQQPPMNTASLFGGSYPPSTSGTSALYAPPLGGAYPTPGQRPGASSLFGHAFSQFNADDMKPVSSSSYPFAGAQSSGSSGNTYFQDLLNQVYATSDPSMYRPAPGGVGGGSPSTPINQMAAAAAASQQQSPYYGRRSAAAVINAAAAQRPQMAHQSNTRSSAAFPSQRGLVKVADVSPSLRFQPAQGNPDNMSLGPPLIGAQAQARSSSLPKVERFEGGAAATGSSPLNSRRASVANQVQRAAEHVLKQEHRQHPHQQQPSRQQSVSRSGADRSLSRSYSQSPLPSTPTSALQNGIASEGFLRQPRSASQDSAVPPNTAAAASAAATSTPPLTTATSAASVAAAAATTEQLTPKMPPRGPPPYVQEDGMIPWGFDRQRPFPKAADSVDRIGEYTREERKGKIARFLKKKRNRSSQPKNIVKYQCRKKFADARPRVHGRFVKTVRPAKELMAEHDKQKQAAAAARKQAAAGNSPPTSPTVGPTSAADDGRDAADRSGAGGASSARSSPARKRKAVEEKDNPPPLKMRPPAGLGANGEQAKAEQHSSSTAGTVSGDAAAHSSPTPLKRRRVASSPSPAAAAAAASDPQKYMAHSLSHSRSHTSAAASAFLRSLSSSNNTSPKNPDSSAAQMRHDFLRSPPPGTAAQHGGPGPHSSSHHATSSSNSAQRSSRDRRQRSPSLSIMLSEHSNSSHHAASVLSGGGASGSGGSGRRSSVLPSSMGVGVSASGGGLDSQASSRRPSANDLWSTSFSHGVGTAGALHGGGASTPTSFTSASSGAGGPTGWPMSERDASAGSSDLGGDISGSYIMPFDPMGASTRMDDVPPSFGEQIQPLQ